MRDNSARNAPSEAIELAAAPDFELGLLRVRPSLRRIGSAAGEVSVEPRVMQALIALVEAGGAVVSRDALIDRCWGGRIVGEDAINRCIAKVRRLAETVEPPAFTIETVSKVGYLLKVSPGSYEPAVTTAPSPPRLLKPFAAPLRPAPTRRRRWQAVLTLCLTITAGAGVELWRSRPSPRWTVQSGHHLPKLDGETNPRFSPNGLMLAYAVNGRGGRGRIYVRDLQGGAPLAVSPPDDDAGSPAWAADSARVAYVAAGGQGTPCRIMVTVVPAGTPQMAGRCTQATTTQIAWQPATPYLFLEDKAPVLEGQLSGFFETIFRLNIETGRSEQVTSPLTSESDFGARVSPDGQWVAYMRERGLQGQALRLRKLASSEEREIVCDPDVNAVDWTPDSQTLIASVPGQMGGEIMAYPIDGARPYRLYASAAVLGGLATGPHGMLAAEVDDGRHNLARATATPHATAEIIDPAPGMTDWPNFAPSGTLAFVSNRSGEMALWIRKPGGQPAELVNAGLKDIERRCGPLTAAVSLSSRFGRATSPSMSSPLGVRRSCPSRSPRSATACRIGRRMASTS